MTLRTANGKKRLTTGQQPVVFRPVRHRVNTIDRLTNRDRSLLPLTRLQEQTLGALSDEPAGPKALAEGTCLSPVQVRSGLLALSAKGLAVRTSSGWRRS